MSVVSLNPSFPALCALLWLCCAGAAVAAEPAPRAAAVQSGMASVAALQAEFFRRVNIAQPVASLFDPRVKSPELGGLRAILLLEDESAALAQAPGADSVRARLRVRVRLQSPFSTDCPAVDAFLLQAGENIREWDELGWMEMSYRRSADGWRITGLEFQPDEASGIKENSRE